MGHKITFKIGEKAVYPAHGVGQVTAIEEKSIGGKKRLFYIINIIENEMKIMVPLDTAGTAGMRKVINKKEAKEVISSLKSKEIAVTTQPWNRRYREYMEMLKSGSIFNVAMVLRDLSRLKDEKDLSFGERRLLDSARSLLVSELSIALKVKEKNINDDIDQIFC